MRRRHHRPPAAAPVLLLFFIDITTREVILAGITTNPTAAWTVQAARNLFLMHGKKLANAKTLVRDRGSQFTASFDEVFRTEGIKVLRTPIRTPVANSIAERWIGTLRRELLVAPSSGTVGNSTGSWSTTPITATPIVRTGASATHPGPEASDRRREHLTEANVIQLPRCDGLINEYQNTA